VGIALHSFISGAGIRRARYEEVEARSSMSGDTRRIEGRWLLFVGLLSVVIGLGAFFRAATAGAELITLGIVVAALGAVIDRTKTVKLTATGFEADLSGRENGEAFVRAAAQASDKSLQSMIPLLCDDVDVATSTVELPGHFDGEQLVGEQLCWIRKELNVLVFAVKRPTDRHWRGGGRIAELRLPAGTHLAVAGDRADLKALNARLEGGNGSGS
jgi:hypothetical protein